MLGCAAVIMAALIALNRFGVTRLAAYIPLGLLLWFFVLQSGIHATIAGVLFALVDSAATLARHARRRALAVAPAGKCAAALRRVR